MRTTPFSFGVQTPVAASPPGSSPPKGSARHGVPLLTEVTPAGEAKYTLGYGSAPNVDATSLQGIRFRFIDQPAGVQKKLARKAKRAKKK